MDWHQAQGLVQEFYSADGFKGLLGCNPFLSDRLFPLYQTDRYEDLYDVKINTINTAHQKYRDIVQDYINKKLSWGVSV